MRCPIIATLCVLGSPVCIDEIVTDTSIDAGITWQSCQIGAQAGIADWMSKHPLSWMFRLLGAPLNKCPSCRLQYYDWRPPHAVTKEVHAD